VQINSQNAQAVEIQNPFTGVENFLFLGVARGGPWFWVRIV
jgi:hypothetical protein